MITLKELNEDPRFRQMTLEELTGVIHDMMGPVTKPTSKDWNDLPGDWSIDKAQNLLSKWAAEGKHGQMVCEDLLLRKLLWLRHGCEITVLYGDDGEMQCGKCGIDFKRDSAESIERKWTNALNWTTEKPKQEGWYWFRATKGIERPLRIDLRNNRAYTGITCGSDWYVLHSLVGEWSSEPIPMPDDK
jgi:hypothetical protein